MRTTLGRLSLLLVFGAAAVAALPARAGLSDQEKALWGASEKAPVSFAVPAADAPAVMGKAQALVSHWNDIDRYMGVMKMQTVTDSLIETYNPVELNEVGFQVSSTRTPQGYEITVDSLYYSGNIFGAASQRKDADKRAHLLAYLLEEYEKTLSSGGDQAPAKQVVAADASAGPAVPEEFDLYLRLARTQIAQSKFDAALKTLEDLRGAIEKAKQAPAPSADQPVAAAPAEGAAPPAAPPAPASSPTDSLKTLPVRARINLASGDSLIGTVKSFDGTAYTVVTSLGTQTVKASDISSVEVLTDKP